jgi:hypothetical protein
MAVVLHRYLLAPEMPFPTQFRKVPITMNHSNVPKILHVARVAG